MFGIGTSEILIILLIALLVLGPKEIPKIAKTLGRGMRELERAKNELRQSIEFEEEQDETSAKSSPDAEDPNEEKTDSREDDLKDINDLPSKHV
ncbi:MAG: twin-arginine translocase TatA/TatE family subunit [Deltaproteobacteria bacterium]